MVAGVQHLRVLKTAAADGFALQPDALEAAVAADLAAGLLPCYVVATIGTTSSCAVDPIPALGAAAKQHGLWCAPAPPRGCRLACLQALFQAAAAALPLPGSFPVPAPLLLPSPEAPRLPPCAPLQPSVQAARGRRVGGHLCAAAGAGAAL